MSAGFKDIALAWGLNGCLGLFGCYLVCGSIMSRLLPVPVLMPRPLVVGTRGQRTLLGVFGALLALPILVAMYLDVFRGIQTSLTPPEIQEKVRDVGTLGLGPLGAEARTVLARGPVAGAIRLAQTGCEEVESFGLEQQHLRRLKFPDFRGEVLVYLDDVKTFKARGNLYVLTDAAHGWPDAGQLDEEVFRRRIAKTGALSLVVTGPGDQLELEHAGRRYLLKVTDLYSVLIGPDKLAISICRLPGPAGRVKRS